MRLSALILYFYTVVPSEIKGNNFLSCSLLGKEKAAQLQTIKMKQNEIKVNSDIRAHHLILLWLCLLIHNYLKIKHELNCSNQLLVLKHIYE